MSKGVLGFKINNKTYVQYVGNNAQFELLGEDLADFVRAIRAYKDGEGWERFKDNISSVELVSSKDDVPEKIHLDMYKSYYRSNMNNKEIIDWYTLLSGVQNVDWFVGVASGKIGHIVDGFSFASEVSHCEYGYILDLDENLFSVYYGLEEVKGNSPFDNTEFGIRLVKSYPLLDIPLTWASDADEVVKRM